MCGIVATASFDGAPADESALQRATDAIAHRGPDDSGIVIDGAVGLGFRRLAILDLSRAGHQPMASADARHVIIFNGEIYNYVEIRRELRTYGRTFRSATDTEVLLQAYDQWGTDCVQHLNGMWAFVIYDKQRRRLFASRDRLGLKPLYRYSTGSRLILASEIKAIVATGLYTPAIDWAVAANFLCRGRLDEDMRTFYQGIDQIPPGSTLELTLDGRASERKFWSLASIAPAPASIDPIESFRELFIDSVRLRMRSDVPVGVSLSGGIDSNAIISTMAKLRGAEASSPLHAFSYIPDEFGEATFIHESVASTGATLNSLVVDPRQLWDNLPRALWYYDEPVHSTVALVGFELMRLARSRWVTVMLSGQGADEVNAGYHSYFPLYWNDLLRAGRLARAAREIATYGRVHQQSRRQLFAAALSRWIRTEARGLPGFETARGRLRYESASAFPWYSSDLVARLPTRVVERSDASLNAALARSVQQRPLPSYLRLEDRNSMAHSIEMRLPFLDYRLVEHAFSLAGEQKLRGPWNKYVVRRALKGIVTDSVLDRVDKMGFPTLGHQWFAGPWHDGAADVLASRALRESGVCNVAHAQRELERHRRGEVDATRELFRLVQFAIWFQRISTRAGVVDEPSAIAKRPSVRVG
jgi:asparagine synthase (glutamine-hydrolysing)